MPRVHLPLDPTTPKKRKRGRGPPKGYGTKFTLAKQLEFCALYAQGGTVPACARKIGLEKVTIFRHARDNPEFKLMYEAAQELNTDDLESMLHQLARAGNVTALFGTLKARRPERWRENYKVEHTGGLVLTSADQLEQARERAKLRVCAPVVGLIQKQHGE